MDSAPFSSPLYLVAKPVGAMCDLACAYCYYLEKADLYATGSVTRRMLMSDETLERFTRQYIEAQTASEVLFIWHGGEPLLRGVSFYRRALSMQRRYACGRHIDNSIQTNGTLLNEEWCRFFRDNHFLVGISIDGEERFHDEYRRDRAGRGTYRRVKRAVGLLQRYGVEWNAMAVVNNLNADYPLEFYRFFKDLGCRYLQFTPVVERRGSSSSHLYAGMREGGTVTSYSVTPAQWGRFLCSVFDEWVMNDVGSVFIQLFDATLANWAGVPPGMCSLSSMCGHAGVIEYNGDVYSCDHFVFPGYKLGNIHERTVTQMMYSEEQRLFRSMKTGSLPRECRECRWLFACYGECPRNRFVPDRYGDPFLNYLCAGYRRFFAHAAPSMDYMKKELEEGRAPANIMSRLQRP